MRIGAIDVGTNSIHLIVVDVDAQSMSTRTVFKAREMVRLGSDDALERGMLGKRAMARGVDAIGRFERLAREQGAERVRAVATSAVREARNGGDFALAVERACGVPLEIVGERDEARLIYLGVSRNVPLYDRLTCIIDIGGGSTEFIVADGRRAYVLESVRLGSLRLYDAFLRDDAPPYRSYAKLRAHIRETMAPVVARIREFNCDLLIGTSGTIMGLAGLEAADRGLDLRRVHGARLELERLRKLQQRMLRMTETQRRAMRGMNPRRADIIIAGAAVLIAALEGIGASELTISEHALREGIVVDLVQGDADVARRLDDVRARRRESVLAFADRFQSLGVHERAVARLALQMFDQLVPFLDLALADRELLHSAALLHDIGTYVNRSAHHKHGAYLIRNAVLDGWGAQEVATMAALVRYHRKASPKATHEEWQVLDPAQRRRIGLLAGILRIAEGLDVRHNGIVSEVEVQYSSRGIVLNVSGDDDVSPEIAGAAFKWDVLAKTAGLPVTARGVRTVQKEAESA